MASIFEKVRVVTLSVVHDLLDAAIDWDDVGALKVHARDLEAAIRQMEEFANGKLARIEVLEDDVAMGQSLALSRQADVDQLLSDGDPGNDSHALVIQVQLNRVSDQLADNERKLAEELVQSEEAEKAVSLMSAKLKEVVARIEELEQTAEETKALEKGAEAMDAMARTFGDLPDVDSVGRKIIEKNAKARAAWNRSLGRASEEAADDETIARAEAALSRRRAELAAEQGES